MTQTSENPDIEKNKTVDGSPLKQGHIWTKAIIL